MFYKFLCLIIVLSISNIVFALSGSIRGKVTDKSTGKNIAGAQIWVLISNTNQIKFQSISDADGNFIIENLENNTYDLECSAASQISQKIMGLQITNNAIRLAYFKMNSNKNLMGSVNSRAYRDSVELIYTYASLQSRQNATIQSATASTQTLFDQPATGYLINADDISFKGYVTLLDVLRDVPEIEINDNASTDFGSVMSSRGATGIGLWYIMQDGIKINSLIGSDISLCQNIPIKHAERIEIIMGAASAVYGADAFSGVINIISKNPEKINGAELNSSFGSFNETNNSLVIAAAKKNLSVLYSGSFFNSQNPKYNEIYTDEYSYYNQNFLTNGLVRRSPFDSTSRAFTESIQPFNLAARAVASSLIIRYKNLSIGLSSFNETHSSSTSTRPEYNPPVADNKYSTSVNSAYISHDYKAKKWSLQSNLQVNQNFIFPKSSYNNTFSSYNRIYKYGYERHLQLREILNYQINKNQQLTAGFSAQISNALARTANLPTPYNSSESPESQIMYHTGTDTVDYTGRFLGVPIEFYQENRVQAGIFAQYQINIKEKLSVIVGGRFDYITLIHPTEAETHTYTPFNARAGLVYKPTKNIRFKLFYGSAFLTASPNKTLSYFGSFRLVKDSLGRITNVAPAVWKLPSNETTNPNSEPVPETVQSIETAFIYTKNDLLISANGYYNILSNALQTETFYNVPFFDSLAAVPVANIVTSEGQGIIYGSTVRVEYKWRIGEQTNIRLNAAYSYIGGYLLDDDTNLKLVLPFTAEHSLKAGLGFQYKKFSIYFKTLYRSASYNEGAVARNGTIIQKGNSSFLIFSAFANYQLAELDKKRFLIDIFLRARNFTNVKYYNTSLINAAAFDAVPQEPFGIFGGVSLRFNR
jgi:outer membrane receptor protein involved in Fe transport